MTSESSNVNPTTSLDSLSSPVKLRAEARPTSYKLSIEAKGFDYSFEFDTEALTLAPLIGNTFTGMMFGVYAFGKGEPVLDPADFTGLGSDYTGKLD